MKDDNVIQFPRTVDAIVRDIERITDESIDIHQRSEALLRWAEDILGRSNQGHANDNYRPLV